MLACVDDPKLDDSTASHPSSWSHSLPHRVVCHPGHNAANAPTIMGGLVLRLQCTCFIYLYTVGRHSAVCFGFGYGYGRK